MYFLFRLTNNTLPECSKEYRQINTCIKLIGSSNIVFRVHRHHCLFYPKRELKPCFSTPIIKKYLNFIFLVDICMIKVKHNKIKPQRFKAASKISFYSSYLVKWKHHNYIGAMKSSKKGKV